MLYNHALDPEENNNVVEESKYASVVNNLKKELETHISNRN